MRRSARTLAATQDSAPLFSALGDETRLWLVARLSEGGPMSIAKLTAGSNLTRQAITKHLRVMDEAGLIHGERSGRENIWQLDQRRVQRARRYLDLIAKRWDVALNRLRDHVSGTD